jgi:hypothetical protein
VAKLIIALLLTIVFSIGGNKVVFAEEASPSSKLTIEVQYESVNPDGGFNYNIKRIKEKIVLLFSFTPTKKAEYQEKLVQKRLSELKYIVDNKDGANIETASQRYSTTVGNLVELIIKNNLQTHKETTLKMLEEHSIAIENLKGSFDDTTAEWRFIKYDEDYLKAYIQQLKS